MNQDVSQRIIAIAAEKAGVDASEVTPASHFVNDLKYDSLTVVEFTMAVEDELEISIPDEDVQTLHTVGDAIAYAQKRATDASAKA